MPRFVTPQLTIALVLSLLPASIHGQQIELSQQYWSAELIRSHGQPVIPLFDGWFQNDDGSNTMCFGYFNLNSEQALDIPIGEANYLSDTRFPTQLPTHLIRCHRAIVTFFAPLASPCRKTLAAKKRLCGIYPAQAKTSASPDT